MPEDDIERILRAMWQLSPRAELTFQMRGETVCARILVGGQLLVLESCRRDVAGALGDLKEQLARELEKVKRLLEPA